MLISYEQSNNTDSSRQLSPSVQEDFWCSLCQKELPQTKFSISQRSKSDDQRKCIGCCSVVTKNHGSYMCTHCQKRLAWSNFCPSMILNTSTHKTYTCIRCMTKGDDSKSKQRDIVGEETTPVSVSNPVCLVCNEVINITGKMNGKNKWRTPRGGYRCHKCTIFIQNFSLIRCIICDDWIKNSARSNICTSISIKLFGKEGRPHLRCDPCARSTTAICNGCNQDVPLSQYTLKELNLGRTARRCTQCINKLWRPANTPNTNSTFSVASNGRAGFINSNICPSCRKYKTSTPDDDTEPTKSNNVSKCDQCKILSFLLRYWCSGCNNVVEPHNFSNTQLSKSYPSRKCKSCIRILNISVDNKSDIASLDVPAINMSIRKVSHNSASKCSKYEEANIPDLIYTDDCQPNRCSSKSTNTSDNTLKKNNYNTTKSKQYYYSIGSNDDNRKPSNDETKQFNYLPNQSYGESGESSRSMWPGHYEALDNILSNISDNITDYGFHGNPQFNRSINGRSINTSRCFDEIDSMIYRNTCNANITDKRMDPSYTYIYDNEHLLQEGSEPWIHQFGWDQNLV